MGLYDRHVFPRLCDWSMRTPRIYLQETRGMSRKEAMGRVAEIAALMGMR